MKTRTQCTVAVVVLVFGLATPAMSQSVNLNWSQDGTRAWFRTESGGLNRFFVLDTKTGKRREAYDQAKLVAALSKKLGHELDPQLVNVIRIAFTNSANELYLRVRGWNWKLNLDSYELTRAEFPEPDSPPLFMPPRPSPAGQESTQISVHNQLNEPVDLLWINRSGDYVTYGQIAPKQTRKQHTYAGHIWMVRTKLQSGCFRAQTKGKISITRAALKNVEQRRPTDYRWFGSRSPLAPDQGLQAELDGHNLSIGQERITFDGTPNSTYQHPHVERPNVRWSPDSSHMVAIRTRRHQPRTVHFIESSPEDQLQPKLHSRDYVKPGDDINTPSFVLYSFPDREQIEIAHDLFPNPWSVDFKGWSKAGDRFYLLYNQRGHQLLRLLEVDVKDNVVRTVIEETSDTFIHYSDKGKAVMERLKENELLWASERTGWNHLYRYSLRTNKLLNAVTSGDWNVKRIKQIDHSQQCIWFYAVGVHPDQDPYHEHFCRVNFDGTGFKVLTEGDGTHKIEFEQDGKYFIDTYSRVDMAPVTELRNSKTGELVTELSREDTSKRFQGRRLTKRFTAKGRDGKTDIWGIIHWPKDFDPNKKYPVVENIYAGPHDHHVPKSFRTRYGHQHRIADADMIVVQIDGMGTAWRSKSFHDVCYKNLRDAGFPDRIAWIKAAAKKFPAMDTTRVGIYGGSAGGQNAMAALLWHNDFYKVAVADLSLIHI